MTTMRMTRVVLAIWAVWSVAGVSAGPSRDLDPVELTGALIPELLGTEIPSIVGFRYLGAWTQIPVQIDERKRDSLARLRGRAGRGQDVVTPVYADAGTVTGPDPDPALDADDELVFLWRDAGNRAEAGAPAGVQPGIRVELRLTDPCSTDARYAYLFVSDGTLAPDAGEDHVRYEFKLLAGHTSGAGPNPEDSLITTARYRNHFRDRWIHDGTEIIAAGATGVDILDGDKFQYRPGVCSRTTETFSLGGGAFIANIDGPVRAIRSVIGANSGALTQRDWICYEGRMTVRTYLRVHPIACTWSFYDLSPEAHGMRYYDNLNPDGFLVDGEPDPARTGVLQWQFVTGPQGSLTTAWKTDTNIPDVQLDSYYFDDSHPDWDQCTGDAFAYAASGPATGGLPDTDGGSPFFFVTDRTLYYDGPGVTVAEAQGRVTAASFPIVVENTTSIHTGAPTADD